MSSRIGVWSSTDNMYLSEKRDELGVYLIDDKSWANWVQLADDCDSDDFVKQRETYETAMSKFIDNARVKSDILIADKYNYSFWVEHHISNYLLFGTDTTEESAEKQVEYVNKLQNNRKQLLSCIEGYIYNEAYEYILDLNEKLIDLDTELKVDGLDKIWRLIWKIMEENKDARKPERVARKSEEVIGMRKTLKNRFDNYLELENLLIKRIMVYISTHSLRGAVLP